MLSRKPNDSLRAVAEAVEALSTRILGRHNVRQEAHQAVLRRALAIRCLGYFQGVTFLTKEGLSAPAGAVLRCLVEHRYLAAALSAEGADEFLSDLLAHGEHNRKSLLRNLRALRPEERDESITDDLLEEIERSLGATRKTQVWEWAERAKMQGDYLTVYASLCSEVHPGIFGIESHMDVDDNGRVQAIRGCAQDGQQAKLYLVQACEAMIDVLAASPEEWLTEDDVAAANGLRKELATYWQRMALANSGTAEARGR